MCGGHAAATVPAATVPTCTGPPVVAVRGELLFLADCSLIANIEISIILIYFGEALFRQFGIDRVPDVLVHNVVYFGGVFQGYPLVGLKSREVCVLVKVVPDILTEGAAQSEQEQCDN